MNILKSDDLCGITNLTANEKGRVPQHEQSWILVRQVGNKQMWTQRSPPFQLTKVYRG